MEREKKHFKLTDETINFNGKTLHRIEALVDIPCFAVSVGDLGGFLESYNNLCDNAWVGNEAKVYGNAVVTGNARIFGSAVVCDNAQVYGDACVYDSAIVSGYASISNNYRQGLLLFSRAALALIKRKRKR